MTSRLPLTIVFRVDGDHAMGLGHIMRCRALAEALLAAGHRCTFLVASPSAGVIAALKAAGIEILPLGPGADRDASATLSQCRALDAAALVIDGYHFDDTWRRRARALDRPILTFADGAFRPDHADLVIDAASAGSSAPGNLFGADYVLLRRELVEAARLPPLPVTRRPTVLVTFGGSDPLGLTERVTTALLARLPGVPLTIVIGPAVVDGDRLAKKLRGLGSRLTIHVSPSRMGELMRRAGLAVTAAGSTVGELAALGVPAILAIIADNQLAGARACVSDGWCEAVDCRSDPGATDQLVAAAVRLWHDGERRAAWAARARGAVDPGGADRAAAALITAIARREAGKGISAGN